MTNTRKEMKNDNLQNRYKFRAWNKTRCYNYTLNGCKDYNDEKGCGYMVYGKQEELECLIIEEKYNIMQYTGLKDKNGKEIYELDLISIGGGELKTIVFYEGAFSFYHKNNEWIQLCYIDLYNTKVIGNIYENSETYTKIKNY